MTGDLMPRSSYCNFLRNQRDPPFNLLIPVSSSTTFGPVLIDALRSNKAAKRIVPQQRASQAGIPVSTPAALARLGSRESQIAVCGKQRKAACTIDLRRNYRKIHPTPVVLQHLTEPEGGAGAMCASTSQTSCTSMGEGSHRP